MEKTFWLGPPYTSRVSELRVLRTRSSPMPWWQRKWSRYRGIGRSTSMNVWTQDRSQSLNSHQDVAEGAPEVLGRLNRNPLLLSRDCRNHGYDQTRGGRAIVPKHIVHGMFGLEAMKRLARRIFDSTGNAGRSVNR